MDGEARVEANRRSSLLLPPRRQPHFRLRSPSISEEPSRRGSRVGPVGKVAVPVIVAKVMLPPVPLPPLSLPQLIALLLSALPQLAPPREVPQARDVRFPRLPLPLGAMALRWLYCHLRLVLPQDAQD